MEVGTEVSAAGADKRADAVGMEVGTEVRAAGAGGGAGAGMDGGLTTPDELLPYKLFIETKSWS